MARSGRGPHPRCIFPALLRTTASYSAGQREDMTGAQSAVRLLPRDPVLSSVRGLYRERPISQVCPQRIGDCRLALGIHRRHGSDCRVGDHRADLSLLRYVATGQLSRFLRP